MKKQNLFYAIIFSLLYTAIFAQYPVSKQAQLVEISSSSEIMVKAVGIYKSTEKRKRKIKKDLAKNGNQYAILDAKRSAVYFVLFNGTDPLIKDSDQKMQFEAYVDKFFSEDAINHFITFEETSFNKRIKIENNTGIKIEKTFKVNTAFITQKLVDLGIITSLKEIIADIGTPFIMVLPSADKGSNPLDLLKNDANLRHGASVIESFLTAKKYDVVVPEQQSTLQKLNQAQNSLSNIEEDYAYNLALSIGSDIYLSFSGVLENAGYNTQKYAVNIRAYETTTARLLGTETGYSQGRRGELSVSIEEAINDAMNNVLSRVNSYWKDDYERGIQYKLITNFIGDFEDDEREMIQYTYSKVLKNIANSTKNSIVTDNTMEHILWCDGKKYQNSFDIYMTIKQEIKKAGINRTVSKLNLNRKLIQLTIE